MEEDNASPGARRQQYQNVRSTNSINWRVRDDNARPEQPQPRFRRDGDDSRPQRGGYARRENSDYNREPREPREIPGKPETPRLYVGNLLYTAAADDITAFFQGNGYNVANVSMSIDPVTGRNPSYCFVDLESVEDATRAMEQLNGSEVLGRTVRINPGVARKEGQGAGSGQRRGYGERAGGASGWRERESNGSFEANPRSSTERWSRPERDSQSSYTRPAPAEQGKRLYIGGLPAIDPQSAVEAEITTLLSRAQPPIEIASVSNLIAPHPSKASEPGDHHYLFVDLKAEADAERAIELFNEADSPWSEGGRLKVNRAREGRERDGQGARRGGRGGERGDRGFGRGGGNYWRSEREQVPREE